MSIRDIKRNGRRDLHVAMSVPALYLLNAGDPNPVPCRVRVHTKFANVGSDFGGIGKNAEFSDSVPRLIIDRLEIPTPVRTAIVSVEVGEAYLISLANPADGDFIPVDVLQLSAEKAAGLPVPEVSNG